MVKVALLGTGVYVFKETRSEMGEENDEKHEARWERGER
jgi:hypothetical protein